VEVVEQHRERRTRRVEDLDERQMAYTSPRRSRRLNHGRLARAATQGCRYGALKSGRRPDGKLH
jgi:hypothetical protein